MRYFKALFILFLFIITYAFPVSGQTQYSLTGQSPVEEFMAVVNNGVVSLMWVVKKELRECDYIIECSADGEHFELVRVLKGYSSPYDVHYHSNVNDPATGTNYYRIKKINDGFTLYSHLAKIATIEPATLLSDR